MTGPTIGMNVGRARVALPPVATRMSWLEWTLLAASWLALSMSAAGTLTERSRESGALIVYRDFLQLQFLDWLAWMAVLWPLFRAFDALPLRKGRWLPQLMGRATATIACTVVHALVAFSLVRGLLSIGTMSTGVALLKSTTLSGMFIDDLNNVIVPLIAYGVLTRVHRRRLELVHATALESSLRAARLHALDLELRPHFLFNTLNGVVALIPSEPILAERMLVTLSDLLRVTMDRTGVEITVADEVAQLELYASIQRLRFGDQLTIDISVDERVRGRLMPAMLLQPLVENALSHGLASKCEQGRIEVVARQDAEWLVLTVSDNGIGLPDHALREGIGIRNSRERLETLYGSQATFTLASADRRGALPGAIATIRIPATRLA